MTKNIEISDELFAELQAAAETELRTTDNQAAWYIRSGLAAGAGHRAARYHDIAGQAELAKARVPFITEMRRIYVAAGQPATRTIAETAGTSHSTVAQLIRGNHISTWPVTEAITRALGGDPAVMRDLWNKAYSRRR